MSKDEAPAVVHKHRPVNFAGGVNIIVVGIGGTGSYVSNYILRLMGGLPDKIKTGVKCTLIDPDTFELKNLGRQLCTTVDIGKNKAEVISGRYGSHYGVHPDCLTFIPEAVKTVGDIQGLLSMSSANIIVDCLDKTIPRGVIHNALKSWCAARKDCAAYLVSSGNAAWNGQVKMGGVIKSNNVVLTHKAATQYESAAYMFSIPMPYTKMPRLMDPEVDKAEAALSCGERAAANVQTLVVNTVAAASTFTYVNQLVSGYVDSFDPKAGIPSISTGGMAYDTKRCTWSVELLTADYLKGDLF